MTRSIPSILDVRTSEEKFELRTVFIALWKRYWWRLSGPIRRMVPVTPETRLEAYRAICAADVVGRVGYRRVLEGAPDVDAVKLRYHLGHIAWLVTQVRGGVGDEVVGRARAVPTLREQAQDHVAAFRRKVR